MVLRPMLLSSAVAPPAPDDTWAYEVKWDGMRTLVKVDGDGLRITSKNGNEFVDAFPELLGLRAALNGRRAVLDGELVCFGPDGRPSFSRVRRRWVARDPRRAAGAAARYPATLVIFDLLELDSESLCGCPYLERRARLAGLELQGPHWLVTGYHVGDGARLVAASRSQGLEGVVAKRVTSRYRPGVRSGDWLKIKNYQRGTFVIGGWLDDGGGRCEALVVGTAGERGLEYAGTVEFGLDGQRRQLTELLTLIPSPRSPFVRFGPRRVGFVEPRLVAQVRFIGWDAGVLREAILERIDLVAG